MNESQNSKQNLNNGGKVDILSHIDITEPKKEQLKNDHPHNSEKNLSENRNSYRKEQKKTFKIIDSEPQTVTRKILNLGNAQTNDENHAVNAECQDKLSNPKASDTNKNLVISNRFKLGSRINAGAFGRVYIVYDLLNGNDKLAAKFEIKKSNQTPILTTDHLVMESVKRKSPQSLIPDVFFFGSIGNTFVLIMELMGPSLEDLFQLLNRSFSLKSILQLAMRSLKAIESFHHESYIHKDIKPDNIVMGGKPGKNAHKCYLIDFGLSERDYRSNSGIRANLSQIRSPNTKNNGSSKPHSLTGTLRYMSINIHQGLKATKLDDLISWIYSMIYLCKSNLPWMGLRCNNITEKYDIIAAKKRDTSPEELCANCPQVFENLLSIFTAKCSTGESPDYMNSYILLQSHAKKNSIVLNNEYDWTEDKFDCTSFRDKKIEDTKTKNDKNKQLKQKKINTDPDFKKIRIVSNSGAITTPDRQNNSAQPVILCSNNQDNLLTKKPGSKIIIVNSKSSYKQQAIDMDNSPAPQNPLKNFNIKSTMPRLKTAAPRVIHSTNFEFISSNDALNSKRIHNGSKSEDISDANRDLSTQLEGKLTGDCQFNHQSMSHPKNRSRK